MGSPFLHLLPTLPPFPPFQIEERAMSGLELISRAPARPNGLPPLLLVHGAFSSASIWEPHFIPYFAELGFAVHAVSLRGHGRSGGGDALAWAGIRDYADDVRSILAGMDEAPVLVGHSMGGMVVQHLLGGRLPVAAAVLMASVPPHGLWSCNWGMAMRHPYLFTQLMLLQTFGPQAADPEALRKVMFSDRVPPAQARRYEDMMQAESKRIGIDLYGPQPVARRPGVPLLVMGAGEDRFFPPCEVRATADAFGTEAEIFPHMGHCMMLEPDWREAADRIADWLQAALPSGLPGLAGEDAGREVSQA